MEKYSFLKSYNNFYESFVKENFHYFIFKSDKSFKNSDSKSMFFVLCIDENLKNNTELLSYYNVVADNDFVFENGPQRPPMMSNEIHKEFEEMYKKIISEFKENNKLKLLLLKKESISEMLLNDIKKLKKQNLEKITFNDSDNSFYFNDHDFSFNIINAIDNVFYARNVYFKRNNFDGNFYRYQIISFRNLKKEMI